MARPVFLMLHGAWHGGWIWDEVASRLEADGYVVHAPDLPGSGADRTPFATITLQSCTRAVCDFVRGQLARVVLVAHSGGGIVASMVAEEIPEHLAAIVHVASFVLPSGYSLDEYRQEIQATSHVFDDGRIEAPDGLSDTLEPEVARRALFNTTPHGVVRRALIRLGPAAIRPRRDRLRLSSNRYGRVPAHYVEAMQDLVIPLASQRAMQANATLRSIHPIDCDHSVPLSAPGTLSEILSGIAAGIK